MKRKDLISAIEYHENQAEIMRHVGYRMLAAEHCRKAKELKLLLALAD